MSTINTIPIAHLILAFLPVLAVVVILFRWSLEGGVALYALTRMLVQLVLVGYVLTFIFETEQPAVVAGVLAIMLLAASWISLRPLGRVRPGMYQKVFVSIVVGGGLTLLLITQGVLSLQPWFAPRFVIPLAGMIFANSMNTVSLAAERFEAERRGDVAYNEARKIALKAALIPITNSLFAVGIVSLPGMMTGQILSGVSPLIAARYQIMVMCMVYGSAGISAACYLMMQDDDKP